MRVPALVPIGALLALACGQLAAPAPPPTPTGTAAGGAMGTPAAVTSRASPRQAPASLTARTTEGAAIDLQRLPLAGGALEGAAVGAAGVALGAGDAGTWTSPWRQPGFAFTRLVPSWNAATPDGTWITVEARAERASGGITRWYRFGTWASSDRYVRRSTVDGQSDADARVDTDTLLASVPLVAYQLRVTLVRSAGSAGTPVLRLAAATASDDAAIRAGAASPPSGRALDLDVPQYSQEIHTGQYPQYGGGGEAWCSPTSLTMVLAYWGVGPNAADMAWIDPEITDPQVAHAARATYDAAYEGTGNWAFGTAYAATFGLEAFVTQLRSLGEAERFIAAGIPLVASLKIAPGALPGFLFPQGSEGHILVIRGFTASGDVIVNEPAVFSNAAVRTVYPRAAFERAWRDGSGGIVYVIRPPGSALPAPVPGATPNW